jgi:CO dehydrogenase maturation factor
MPENLFDAAAEARRAANAPLADRMRPRTLDEFIGQEHILGEGKLLRRAIEADRVTSVIFFGPPGTGKTTLAGTLARAFARQGERVLAVDADSNPNLAAILGVRNGEPREVVELPRDLLKQAEGADGTARTVLARPVEEILDDFSVAGPDGLRLVTMGRVGHAGRGCMCRGHSTVRTVVGELVERSDGWASAVVLDMEAGLEHLSRGTARHVTGMFAVMEPYYRAMETGRRVVELGRELGMERPLVVANKIRGDDDRQAVRDYCARHELEIAAEIPFDPALMEAERAGTAPLDFDPDSPAVTAVRALAEGIRPRTGA